MSRHSQLEGRPEAWELHHVATQQRRTDLCLTLLGLGLPQCCNGKTNALAVRATAPPESVNISSGQEKIPRLEAFRAFVWGQAADDSEG